MYLCVEWIYALDCTLKGELSVGVQEEAKHIRFSAIRSSARVELPQLAKGR